MKVVKFTLVELLVAIAIIGALVAVSVGASEYVSYYIKESKTKSQIQRLELALERYLEEYDFYYVPCDKDGKAAKGEVEFNPYPLCVPKDSKMHKKDYGIVRFCSRAENAKNIVKDQDYVPKTFLGEDYTWVDDKATIDEQLDMGLRDGWDNLLMYRFPGKHNKAKFDIWSRGPDGEGLSVDGGGQTDEDDITNWNSQK